MEVKQVSENSQLFPLDWDSERQEELLREQRIICGWGNNNVHLWRECARKGQRTMFWIGIPPEGELGKRITTAQKGLGVINFEHDGCITKYLAVGHVALDRIDVPSTDTFNPEPTLVAEDGSVLTIAALFVMPEFSRFRLGTFAVRRCEELAQQQPYGSENCRAVTVNSLSPRHTKGGMEGPEGMGAFDRMGLPVQENNSVPWFKKLGYVPYKEAPRYLSPTLDGTKVHLWCIYLRKDLEVKA
ncbi:hypothetical protein K461DRAFT_290089 [Myriangium duriaei CBS 260.36]|uniref:Uncharacterized protein n=1 Tax=Myriangium duriaei CBS 260.36 TaxID=1168546 RepID=A0A9P4MM02_9PEZI|nr:hypothetical protein K461DRAFT_290089 [Myriangium duriaei CBS 260.36]